MSSDSHISLTVQSADVTGTVTSQAPYETMGKIGDRRFFFRVDSSEYQFAVSGRFSNHSDPRYIAAHGGNYSKRETITFKPAPAACLELLKTCVGEYLKAAETRPPEYQDRVVAFIDVLGFSQRIRQSGDSTEILDSTVYALQDVQQEFIDHPNSEIQRFFRANLLDLDMEDSQPMITQVSDSVIISRLAMVKGAVQDLIIDVSYLTHLFQSHHFLVRGAIRVGKVIHTDRLILGPGYIAAVEGEKAFPNPAVNIDETVMALGRERMSDDHRLVNHFNECVIQDPATKLYILDYFNDYERNIDLRLTAEEHYAGLKNIIEHQLQIATDPKVKAKYEWMRDGFNESAIVKSGRLEPIATSA